MKKILLKGWPVLLILIGVIVILYSHNQEEKARLGHQLYDQATVALESGDYELSYSLYLQSAYETKDKKLAAQAFYMAASVGWAFGIADYNTLVYLYQQSLRSNPDLYASGFNLEYLYWLEAESPNEIPQPGTEPGQLPSEEEEPSNGDT